MGKDFKIGLVSGLGLAILALIWVATRPSLSTHARMSGPPAASSGDSAPGEATTPAAPDSRTPSPADDETTREETLPPGLIAAEPETAEQPPLAPPTPTEEPTPASYERTEKITTTRFHIVRQGENLSAISQRYYNTPNQWQKILEANQDILKDPNKIAVGMKLIIPE